MTLPGKSRENPGVIGDPTSGIERVVGINLPEVFSLLLETTPVHIVLEVFCILPLGSHPRPKRSSQIPFRNHMLTLEIFLSSSSASALTVHLLCVGLWSLP